MNFGSSSMYSDPSGPSEQEVVTRTFKIHRFDPHPRRMMLIIRGDLMISVTSPMCNMVLAEDTREFKKVICLEGLSKESDRETIIEEILKSCPFIDMDLVPHLSITVEYLRNRKYDDKGLAVPVTGQQSNSSTPVSDFPDYFEDESMLQSETVETEFHEKFDMASLESYVELLYEDDFGEKVRGARLLSKLAKISENLVSIAYHESALNALFRTLREDYKKSMDLTTYILSVCLCYAQFTDFHKLLTSHKVCTITFDIIEFELLRYEKWALEVARRQEITEMEPAVPKFRSEFEKMKQKFGELTRKQDALLSVAFDILLHMSENKFLHREILGRGIIPMLVSTLERKNLDLLSVVLTFLKNLSLFAQVKTQLSQLRIVENITELLNASVPKEIIDLCLGLLFNLCFDTRMRHKLVKLEMLPKVASFVHDAALEHNTRKILYLMSMDRRIRPKLASLKIVPVVLRLLDEHRDKLASNLEVPGIAINLSKTKRAASIMCENNGLVQLLQQAFENEDPLVMKIVRNISEHPNTKPQFRDFTCDLARAIGDASSNDFVMECTGTLSNLDLPNIDYCKILGEFGLTPWIQSVLMRSLTMASAGKPPTAAGQSRGQKSRETQRALMTLEIIVLIGTCAGDEDAAEMLIEEGILELLIKILVTNGPFGHSTVQQNQMKHQILYVFFKFCCHPESRRYIQEKTRIPKIILEILNDHRHGNGRSQQICEAILDLFGECDKEWLEKLKEKRFTLHNEAWIDMTARGASDVGDFDSILGQSSHEYRNLMHDNRNGKFTVEFPPGVDGTEDDYEDEVDDDDEDDEEEFDEEDDGMSSNGDAAARSIFDRFRAQYEQEKKVREEWEKELSEDENDDDESLSSPSIDAQWDAAFKVAMIQGNPRKSAVGENRKVRPKSEFRH
ncbi:unnamed protein product [Orchesella dallaii]|uniref:Kinesin-associated protein 3 n=1 Tax=Orchesella dallaii TaxID=48710 RepID=A0ABP1PK74_9HEXA